MIEAGTGDLLRADVEALVNTVNCVGVMGKGLALQFRQAFPENFNAYQRACKANTVLPGRMFIFETRGVVNPRYIINFPTKRHWRGDSKIEDIESGLRALVADVRRLGIRSIALPPLGCGNGGLDWDEVRPRIEGALSELPGVRALVFAPAAAPTPDEMKVATKRPIMTLGRALLLKLLGLYGAEGYRHTRLEIQKLAYLLQARGEPLRLDYVPHLYGPYAEALNHVLQHMEGHYLRGYGDRSGQAEIHMLPGAEEEADDFLASAPAARDRLEAVAKLIDGFASPYGLELLATVHWVVTEKRLRDDGAIVRAVRDWSKRKAGLFRTDHIIKAVGRLRDQGWIEPAREMADAE